MYLMPSFRKKDPGSIKRSLPKDVDLDGLEIPLRAELYSPEQLERHAEALAGQHKISSTRRKEVLLPRLRINEKIIDQTYQLVTEMVRDGTRMPPAAEWLLDNYYVIKEHIELAHEHLPRKFSRELPVLSGGAFDAHPRIYHLATELIAHVDGRVDIGNLSSFINGYQHKTCLTVGELWAVPIMLRLALIENLRRVAQRIRMSRGESVSAAEWSKRLVAMATNDPKNLVLVLADMVNAKLPSSNAFIAELCRSLQGQSSALALALSWFDQHLAEQGQSVEHVILAESQGQAADQVSIGNTITSLRMLSAEDWRKFVERHSAMEKILNQDPAGIYPLMRFESRDMYRHVLEKISKRSSQPEVDVAMKVVELAKNSPAAGAHCRERHIGYFLIDQGLHELENFYQCRVPFSRPATKTGLGWRLFSYLGGILLLTAGLAFPLIYALQHAGFSTPWIAALSTVFAICASQTALPLCNAIATLLVKPQALPQLDFTEGIPETFRTVVAVPTMLGNAAGVDKLIEGVELRFLANRDANLFFALLTDFPDADTETKPGDADLLERARQGIIGLNARYADGRSSVFYLFHRPRRWNEREKTWMGFERKRGKLAEFNHVLRGAGLNRFTSTVGDLEPLLKVKYVIPLDTDTQIPANAARRLVGAMAHILNQPIYDVRKGRVIAGYGLMQPRVTLNLSRSRQSWFVRIYARDAGVDPYTRAVSDVYQDLFGEGSFVGKGIYEVDAFERACSHFPENRILSHDLIEGCYVRSGLLSDAELFEDYPSRFNADAKRRHRWMRGDWQIASWLLPLSPRKTTSHSAVNAQAKIAAPR